MISRILNIIGVDLGNQKNLLLGKAVSNPKGFWEFRMMTKLNEKVLNSFNHTWDSSSPLPKYWKQSKHLNPFKVKLKKMIKRNFQGSPIWGWKDPRNSLLIPIWEEVLQDLSIRPCYLIVVRNPLDVANSLKTRDGFTLEKSLKLWALYTLSAFINTNNKQRAVIHYDLVLNDWESNIKKITETLDIPWSENDKNVNQQINDFISHEFRHSQSKLVDLQKNKEVPNWIVKTYETILAGIESKEFMKSEEFSNTLTTIYNEQFNNMKKSNN